MTLLKKIGWSIFGAIAALQFFQPSRNRSDKMLPTDITKIYPVSDTVLALLKTSCYDCHSNNTKYPWYAYVQPVGWFLNKDIQNGKEQLNFSEFGTYKPRRQKSKLISINKRIKDGSMPLPSYLHMHKDAELTDGEKKMIFDWIKNTTDNLPQNKTKNK